MTSTDSGTKRDGPEPSPASGLLCAIGFDELRTANVTRCEQVFHPLEDWSPTDWACAMAGECGEACNNVKKLRRLDGADHSLDSREARLLLRSEIGKELADLVIYADLLAARLQIDLGLAVVEKFNVVSERRSSTVRLAHNIVLGRGAIESEQRKPK